jgi:metal-responsive CopG/Arc/MetJ family transcriptional regulator
VAFKHINITLPEKLIEETDRVATKYKCTRSGFIRIALFKLVRDFRKKSLIAELKKGYEEMAEESLKITKEMEKLEEESLKHIGDKLIEW